ncbi:hypothetical protein E3N88_22684 [Mikania micrantha]|uniref:CCHC-type domain-containing protein n=1 Tax=Mikania micrantha TaxID=192012 RepID=A0A5N6NCK4_9ASTR|nr:hypothetical protein E3N88_22684 [Mikania micrantha]
MGEDYPRKSLSKEAAEECLRKLLLFRSFEFFGSFSFFGSSEALNSSKCLSSEVVCLEHPWTGICYPSEAVLLPRRSNSFLPKNVLLCGVPYLDNEKFVDPTFGIRTHRARSLEESNRKEGKFMQGSCKEEPERGLIYDKKDEEKNQDLREKKELCCERERRKRMKGHEEKEEEKGQLFMAEQRYGESSARGRGRGRSYGRGERGRGRSMGRGGDKSRFSCFNCGTFGHFGYECIKWKDEEKEANLVEEEEPMLG